MSTNEPTPRERLEQIRVYWVDARSEEGWVEQKDVEPVLARITTLGFCVHETEEVLCVAGSVDDVTGQVSSLTFIPQQCIRSRVVITTWSGDESTDKAAGNTS